MEQHSGDCHLNGDLTHGKCSEASCWALARPPRGLRGGHYNGSPKEGIMQEHVWIGSGRSKLPRGGRVEKLPDKGRRRARAGSTAWKHRMYFWSGGMGKLVMAEKHTLQRWFSKHSLQFRAWLDWTDKSMKKWSHRVDEQTREKEQSKGSGPQAGCWAASGFNFPSPRPCQLSERLNTESPKQATGKKHKVGRGGHGSRLLRVCKKHLHSWR